MLLQQGFKQGNADTPETKMDTFILAYVDNLVLVTHQKTEYMQIVHKLGQEVQIKELGDATFYLGIQIERKADDSYLLSQKQKTVELLHALGMQDARAVATPMQTDFLKNIEEHEPLPDNNTKQL